MSEYRSYKEGANRDFRDQFKSVDEYKAAVARLPKVPSLIPNRGHYKENQGLNRAPTYSRYRKPRCNNQGYNSGKLNLSPTLSKEYFIILSIQVDILLLTTLRQSEKCQNGPKSNKRR